MREYFTEAIVLGSKSSGVADRIIDLYTKDFGRLQAKVGGGRKITSKLSPHLTEANLVAIRLVEKTQFTIADAMIKERFPKTYLVFDLLYLLRSLLPEFVPDLQFWHLLLRSLKEGKINNRIFLKFLGYNSLHARCESCGEMKVSYFLVTDQTFLCRHCFTKFRAAAGKILSLNHHGH